MDCAQTRRYIECYVDGEVDAVTASAVEQHLDHCAVCQRDVDRLTSLRSLIREALPYWPVPERLSRDIRARLVPPATERGFLDAGWWKWFQPAALVAVTAIVTWIAASQLHQPDRNQLVAEDVIASHARSALTGHIVDVASSERHTVKPWFSSKLDFSPPVVDLSGADFPLTGGRLDYVDHRPVAVLIYGRRKHVIDLLVWPTAEERRMPSAEVLSKQGYQVLSWTDGGMQFWAISDLNAKELKLFAEKFAAAK